MKRALTLREVDVIDLVVRAFPTMTLSAFVTQEADASKLCFVLDDGSSTELPRRLFDETEDAVEDLAESVVAKLTGSNLALVEVCPSAPTPHPVRQIVVL